MDKQHEYWWQHEDLDVQNQLLQLSGRTLLSLAKSIDQPFYAYSGNRIKSNIHRIQTALAGIEHEVFYALKANRFAPLVQTVFNRGVGVDVCSPKELFYAIQQGFLPQQISYNGCMMSNADLAVLERFPDVFLYFDSISALRRCSTFRKSVGLRINPQIGMGYNQSLEYAGEESSKFGIYPSEFNQFIEVAQECNVTIERLHFHAGSGYLTSALAQLKTILGYIEESLLPLLPDVKVLNVGGGLGVPQQKGDEPLNVKEWGQILTEFAEKHNVHIHCEPGDYIVKDAGLLVAQVNTVEVKNGINFVGLNVGMNVINEAAYYQMHLEPVPLCIENRPKNLYRIVGNINEPVDVFHQSIEMSELQEGDYLALLNAGGYGSAAASNHCMRGDFLEVMIHG